MKVRDILLTLIAGALLIGCTPTPNRSINSATIKKNILGTWYSKNLYNARDSVKIQSRAIDTFYRNGTLLSTEYLTYIDKKGKVLGKIRYKRYFKWSLRGNELTMRFRNCTSRILKRPRNNKVEFVTDIMNIACKYANRLSRRKISSEKIYDISRHKLMVGDKILYR